MWADEDSTQVGEVVEGENSTHVGKDRTGRDTDRHDDVADEGDCEHMVEVGDGSVKFSARPRELPPVVTRSGLG